MRRAIALSTYPLTFEHVPGEQNEMADFLSRPHHDNEPTQTPLSNKESIRIIKRLSIPDNYYFDQETVRNLLLTDIPIPSLEQRKQRKNKQTWQMLDITENWNTSIYERWKKKYKLHWNLHFPKIRIKKIKELL